MTSYTVSFTPSAWSRDILCSYWYSCISIDTQRCSLFRRVSAPATASYIFLMPWMPLDANISIPTCCLCRQRCSLFRSTFASHTASHTFRTPPALFRNALYSYGYILSISVRHSGRFVNSARCLGQYPLHVYQQLTYLLVQAAALPSLSDFIPMRHLPIYQHSFYRLIKVPAFLEVFRFSSGKFSSE